MNYNDVVRIIIYETTETVLHRQELITSATVLTLCNWQCGGESKPITTQNTVQRVKWKSLYTARCYRSVSTVGDDVCQSNSDGCFMHRCCPLRCLPVCLSLKCVHKNAIFSKNINDTKHARPLCDSWASCTSNRLFTKLCRTNSNLVLWCLL